MSALAGLLQPSSRTSSPSSRTPSPPPPEQSRLRTDDTGGEPEELTPRSSVDGRSSSYFHSPLPSQYRPYLKRKASEDLTEFAAERARRCALNEQDAADTCQFSKLSIEQMLITLYANQKKQAHSLKVQLPWTISVSLQDKIRKMCFVVLIDPGLTAYLKDNHPGKKVLSMLLKFPGWGYTTTVAPNAERKRLIDAFVRETLTEIRSEMKSVIMKSVHDKENNYDDIDALGGKILALRAKLVPRARLSIQMEGRFALLRQVYVFEKEKSGAGRDFWNKVDENLAEARKSIDEGKLTASDLLNNSLNQDREAFPPQAGTRATSLLNSSQFSVQDQFEPAELTEGHNAPSDE